MDYRLSIVIPCYNSENYIHSLFNDIVSQTIHIENLQVIFVDDNSSDSTRSILKELQVSYPDNVVCIYKNENKGVSNSRNLGVMEAQSKYITFCDHDDVLEDNLFETMLRYIETGDFDFAMCDSDVIAEQNPVFKENPVVMQENVQSILLKNIEDKKNFVFETRGIVECWKKVIKRSFLIENDITFPESMWGEDFYWWTLMGIYAEKVVYIPEVLYHHVASGGGVSNKIMSNWFSAQMLLLDEAKKRNIYNDYSDLLDFLAFERGFASTIFYWIKCGDYNLEEIDELRRILLSKIRLPFSENSYILMEEVPFQYKYSKGAIKLLEKKISPMDLLMFLKEALTYDK